MIILPYSDIPFRIHVYFCTRFWEKRLKTQETRFCGFIHCREVLQTSESSLMLEQEGCTIITRMDLVSLLSCYSSIGNCANHDWFQYIQSSNQQLSILIYLFCISFLQKSMGLLCTFTHLYYEIDLGRESMRTSPECPGSM